VNNPVLLTSLDGSSRLCQLFSIPSVSDHDHRSHPDVAERHYPELFKKYFPNGLPTQGSAY